MFSEILNKMISMQDMSFETAKHAMDQIMAGEVDEANLASFLTALKIKGESIDEIAGFAASMIENADGFEKNGYYIDTCGTGGDGKEMINVSSIAALIAACAGVRVAKHGNRSVSSRCGSADLYEGLGMRIDLEPQQTKAQLEETGFAFLFAPVYHKAMKHAMPVRKKLGIPTVFNILGPLSNPARVDGQVIGVFRKDLVMPMAEVLKKIGLTRAMVVHGSDGSDEISVSSDTYIAELRDGQITEWIYIPKKMFSAEGAKGGDVEINVKRAVDILENKETGAGREIVLQNAAAAMVVSGKTDDIAEGYEIADQILRDKAGIDKLDQIIRFQKNI